ncbi:hypothetical protein Tco_0430053 [Tanacetum coccineum]
MVPGGGPICSLVAAFWWFWPFSNKMIRVSASNAFSFTFTIFVVSASLKCLFSFRGCLMNLPLPLKNFLKSLTAMAYSSSSLLEVEHSSSLDSFLAFKARDFLLTLALTI